MNGTVDDMSTGAEDVVASWARERSTDELRSFITSRLAIADDDLIEIE